jgi:hypothetical protein
MCTDRTRLVAEESFEEKFALVSVAPCGCRLGD